MVKTLRTQGATEGLFGTNNGRLDSGWALGTIKSWTHDRNGLWSLASQPIPHLSLIFASLDLPDQENPQKFVQRRIMFSVLLQNLLIITINIIKLYQLTIHNHKPLFEFRDLRHH